MESLHCTSKFYYLSARNIYSGIYRVVHKIVIIALLMYTQVHQIEVNDWYVLFLVKWRNSYKSNVHEHELKQIRNILFFSLPKKYICISTSNQTHFLYWYKSCFRGRWKYCKL